MIVIKLQGGLGNQMLEYAFGQALANATGNVVKYDALGYGRGGRFSRRWRLAREFLKCKFYGRNWGAHRTSLRLLDLEYFVPDLPEADLREISAAKGNLSYPTVFTEQNFIPTDVPRARDGYYDGTWSLRFLDTLTEQLPGMFPVKAKAEMILPVAGSVCVHVRRGDFTTSAGVKKHGLCQPKYYESAAAAICKRAGGPLRFYVFSDDVPWCREYLRFAGPTVFMEMMAARSSALSLDIMRQCEHFVLSNSTFSLWTAVLGRKPRSQVITPLPWFDRDPSWTSGLCGDIRLDKISGELR